MPSNPFPLLRHRGSEMPSVTVLPPSTPAAFPLSSSSASSSLYGFSLFSCPYSSFAPRPTERSPGALRGHIRRRDQGTGDTGGCDFSHPFRQGSDFPCAVIRKCRRLQVCPQCIHQGIMSYPGIHGHCRFQGRKCSRKTRCAVEGVY